MPNTFCAKGELVHTLKSIGNHVLDNGLPEEKQTYQQLISQLEKLVDNKQQKFQQRPL